jgi:misacylated tRNA(Ala) deacylase
MTQKLYLETPYEKQFEAEVIATEGNTVRLSRSLFYPTSGGQPGDTGTLKAANHNFDIATTQKDKENDDVIHVLAEGCPLPQIGDKITGEIDWDTRYKHMRMHTAMHLLCSLITGDATGGQIGAEKSRLDFNVPGDAYDKEALTEQINKLIEAGHPVSTSWITDEELEANPQLVRTMSVKPPIGSGKVRVVQIGTNDNIVDYQPCGGTHVKNTGEIGKVRISKIENKGKQNRRFHIVFDEE